MLTFAQTILKLMNQYKAINKKSLSLEEWTTKMNLLGLRRKQLREDDEVSLYHKAHRVLEDIKERIAHSNISYWYSGIDEFHQYFKNILSEYHVENNKVVHGSQQASRAMVLALQLIEKTGTERSSHQVANQLDQCGQVIAKYGSYEQRMMFSKTLKNFQYHDINFYQSLYEKYEQYMEKFAQYFAEEEVA